MPESTLLPRSLLLLLLWLLRSQVDPDVTEAASASACSAAFGGVCTIVAMGNKEAPSRPTHVWRGFPKPAKGSLRHQVVHKGHGVAVACHCQRVGAATAGSREAHGAPVWSCALLVEVAGWQ